MSDVVCHQDNNFRFIIRIIGNGVLLTDFFKVSDCLLHDLFIAKLATYGFGYTSLQLIQIYYPIDTKLQNKKNAYSANCD